MVMNGVGRKILKRRLMSQDPDRNNFKRKGWKIGWSSLTIVIEFFGYSSPGIIIDNSTRVYITV
jgi:hypothetical protein